MIVEQMTLRVKNIIFFKAVCICISVLILSYFINSLSDELKNTQERSVSASAKFAEEENRLSALKSDDKKLQEVIQTYLELKQNQAQNITKDCFDKTTYTNKIIEAEKEFGLNDASTIKVSALAPSKINNLQQNLVMNRTSVIVEYHVSSFSDALKFAQTTLVTMPENTILNGLVVTKHSSLTPTVASWLEKSNDVDLTSVSVDMELRTIGLSDGK